MFAVVQHKQQVRAAKTGDELVDERGVALLANVDGGRDLAADQCRLGQRGQVDEGDTVLYVLHGLPGCFDRQPGFADPAHTTEGQESVSP